MSWYANAMRRLGRTRAFAAVMPRIAPPVDRAVHRLTRGRTVAADAFLPTLLLTCVGRKTGQLRRQPLAYVRDGDAYVLAATNWGRDHHPAWSANLLAEPRATIEVDGRTIPVIARLAEPEERERLWLAFVAMWPAYEAYAERSGRDIRVFLLEPQSG